MSSELGCIALPPVADIRVAAEIHAECLAALDAVGDVTVDCGAVEWIDGAVLQCLVAFGNSLRSGERKLVLANPTDVVDRALTVTGLDEVLL